MKTVAKILYIEDDPGSQLLVSRILEAQGYSVVVAESGLDGIRQARRERPGLILMDINIGDLDGYEVTTRLRSIDHLKQVPIVALTANVLQGDRERALVAGCSGYLTKPLNVDSFPDQVKSYLEGHREVLSQAEQLAYLSEYNSQIVEHLESKVVALEKANQALKRVEKMKSDFIVLSAHELRTPLAIAYGYSRLLVTTEALKPETTQENDKASYLADKIFSSLSRLNEVVNDIVNIALIQANEMKLNLEAVSLERVVNAALVELDPWQKGRSVVVNIEPPLAGLPDIEADPERLQQVFWNLLSNAVKYTPDGGTISIVSQQDDTHISMCVQDTGIGIPPEEQGKIFEQFYVTSDTDYHTSSKVDFMGGGMGIGLSIVKGILDAHHAEIAVESSGVEGEGTTFHLRFLIKQSDAYAP